LKKERHQDKVKQDSKNTSFSEKSIERKINKAFGKKIKNKAGR